jgi:HEAT repeat protein
MQRDPTLHQVYNQREIIKTLGRIGPSAAAAAPKPIQLLDEAEPVTAIEASFALERIGPAIAIEIATSIGDKDLGVRGISLAAQALSHLGVQPRCVVWIVARALSDPRCLVRQYAVETLGQIAPDMTILPVLVVALYDTDEDVRSGASRSIMRVLFRELLPWGARRGQAVR